MFAIPVDDETELVLLEDQHAEELFALVDGNRASLREWLPWLDDNTCLDHTRAFIRSCLEQHADRDGFTCGLRHRGALAGVIGLHFIDWRNRRTSLGYWLAESHRGRGLVTRACAALLGQLFGELGLNCVEVSCATGNLKSCAIPERLGFTREGVRRQGAWLYDHFVDLVVYGMLAAEWNHRRRSTS